MCNYYNIHFFVFTYEDVDIKNNSIQGVFFKNGKWIKQVTDFPDVVDNVPMDRKKYPKVFDALSKKSIMTTPGLGSKSFIYDKMRTSDKLKKYLIPFKSISSYSDLEELLISYKSVIIKPHLSNQGKGIFKMDIDKHSVNISTDTEKWSIPLSQLSDFYYKELKNINTVAQHFINSKTKDGSPFDIRVHVRKVSNHNWRKVAMYPRIGIYINITSNVNSGGAISPLVPFLKKNFQKSWINIKEDLDLLYEEIISSIEGLFNKNILVLVRYFRLLILCIKRWNSCLKHLF